MRPALLVAACAIPLLAACTHGTSRATAPSPRASPTATNGAACDRFGEGPIAVLTLDASGSHRYTFLSNARFEVVGDASAPVATYNREGVAVVWGAPVVGRDRYTRFFTNDLGTTTVSAIRGGKVVHAVVTVVCHTPASPHA